MHYNSLADLILVMSGWRGHELCAAALREQPTASATITIEMGQAFFCGLRRPQTSQGDLLARSHPRVTFHFTPTSASWLNAVEGFFAVLTNDG
jgi:hypothetical protein